MSRVCKYCGKPLKYETYTNPGTTLLRAECFCDNEDCPIKPCSDFARPSEVAKEIPYFSKAEGE